MGECGSTTLPDGGIAFHYGDTLLFIPQIPYRKTLRLFLKFCFKHNVLMDFYAKSPLPIISFT